LAGFFVPLASVPFVTLSADMTMSATAFALHGRTASGVQAQRGIVSADPRILPLGTVIRRSVIVFASKIFLA
jgi:3D (Asp-Asp-Asp) domain-containing protein